MIESWEWDSKNEKMLTSQKITHGHNTVIADIVCGKKNQDPLLYIITNIPILVTY